MADRVNHDRANRNGEPPELDELLHAFCDDRLDQPGQKRLASLLSESDDACRRYLEFVHLCIGMSYPSAVPGDSRRDGEQPADTPSDVATVVDAPLPSTLSIPPLGEDPSPLGHESPNDTTFGMSRFWPHFSMGTILTFATICLVAATIANWTAFRNPIVEQSSPPGSTNVAKVGPSPAGDDPQSAAFVARIVKASTDCRWGKLTTPVEFLVRVRAGDQMHIAAGLVELEFYSGARVILHGPAVFTPTGIASGHLESGRLTGQVADGNFRLMTPAAEVIDLGTSFGVAADAAVGTDVVVFDGRVQVVSVAEGRTTEPLDMTEGMAARFRVDGSTEYGLHTDAAQFKRVVPTSRSSASANEICLIDVIAGGDGLGSRLAGAIDPLTGEKDYGEREQRRQFSTGRSTNQYRPSPWNAIIDGVFIPSQRGGQRPITSRGLTINLPRCNGQTWGPIWARRKDSLLEAVDRDFWGDVGMTDREGGSFAAITKRLKETRNGLAGIHSNVGITFDLQAMRLLHRQGPVKFRAAVANMENSRIGPLPAHVKEPPSASFHVYVDGELQYERLGFRGEDGEEEFSVSLTPENRFLTIISTDNGDGYYYDHVVLIDPVIELEKEL